MSNSWKVSKLGCPKTPWFYCFIIGFPVKIVINWGIPKFETNLKWFGGFYNDLHWGYPQIIHLNKIFHYKPSSYWGTPMTIETPICFTPHLQIRFSLHLRCWSPQLLWRKAWYLTAAGWFALTTSPQLAVTLQAAAGGIWLHRLNRT